MRPQTSAILSFSLMSKSPSQLAIPVDSRILILRHQRVILDSDLAELYGVTVKGLNQQIKRNRERFPADFMFRLTGKEDQILRSQIVTSSKNTAAAATRPTPSPSTARSWRLRFSIRSRRSK